MFSTQGFICLSLFDPLIVSASLLSLFVSDRAAVVNGRAELIGADDGGSDPLSTHGRCLYELSGSKTVSYRGHELWVTPRDLRLDTLWRLSLTYVEQSGTLSVRDTFTGTGESLEEKGGV